MGRKNPHNGAVNGAVNGAEYLCSKKTMINLFCFGYGYTAQSIATLVKENGGTAQGTSRTSTMTMNLPFSSEQRVPASALENVTHILISIPPQQGADLVWNAHVNDFKTMPHLQWIGYLSTTGVYGDMQGEWVDETTKCQPSQQRSQERYHVEQRWLSCLDLPMHIFRLSGIYGSKRNVFEQIYAGTAQRICKPGHVFSRIHQEDLAQIIYHSMCHPTPGEIYNVADDLPTSQQEVIEYACDLLKAPYPALVPFKNAELSPMAKSFYAECRRVNNDKIKDALGIKLKFPTFREGLERLVK